MAVTIENGNPIVYLPNTRISEGSTTKDFNVPVGSSYAINAYSGIYGIRLAYDFADIQGDCSGRDFCDAIMGPDGAQVTIIFYYRLI